MKRRLLLLAVASLISAPVSAAAETPTVAGWGSNYHYDLGAGYRSSISAVPLFVQGLSGVKQVAIGGGSGFAVLENGTLDAWGGNDSGQLGNGTKGKSPRPQPVPGLTEITAVAVAGEHVLALRANGHVYAWGGDTYGELGNGTTCKGKENCALWQTTPIEVAGITTAVSVATGGATDAVILRNGSVEAWGENLHGEIGDGTFVEKTSPTVIKGLNNVKQVAIGGQPTLGGHALALLSNGTVESWGGVLHQGIGNVTGEGTATPTPVPGLGNVVQVSAGWTDSDALLANGTLLSWGENIEGELGHRSTETCGQRRVPCSRKPTPVPGSYTSVSASGFEYTAAVSDRHVYTWGRNRFGNLGNGSTAPTPTPTPVAGLGNVLQAVAGEWHAAAITSSPPVAPSFEVQGGPQSVTATWSLSSPTPWAVSWRKMPASRQEKGGWSKRLFLSPSAGSWTVNGLVPGQQYEVKLGSSVSREVIAIGTATSAAAQATSPREATSSEAAGLAVPLVDTSPSQTGAPAAEREPKPKEEPSPAGTVPERGCAAAQVNGVGPECHAERQSLCPEGSCSSNPPL